MFMNDKCVCPQNVNCDKLVFYVLMILTFIVVFIILKNVIFAGTRLFCARLVFCYAY